MHKKYNLVRCGMCSYPFAHDICNYQNIKCPECRAVLDKSDCPDFDIRASDMTQHSGSEEYAFLSDMLSAGFDIVDSTPSGEQLLSK